jgi:hypothetical protein
MTQRTRKLLMALFILAVALGIGTVPAQNAVAAACCETCDAGELACVTAPSQGPCYGNSDCCYNLYKSCYRNCIVCS